MYTLYINLPFTPGNNLRTIVSAWILNPPSKLAIFSVTLGRPKAQINPACCTCLEITFMLISGLPTSKF